MACVNQRAEIERERGQTIALVAIMIIVVVAFG